MLGLGLTQYIPFFAYAACIIVIIATFFKARYGLFLLAFLVPLQNLSLKLIEYPFGKDILDLLMIACFIRMIFQRKQKANSLDPNKIKILILSLIISTYAALWIGSIKLGLPYPIDIGDSRFVDWKNFIMAPLLFFLVVQIIETKQQAKFLVLIMVISVLLSALNFYQTAKNCLLLNP